MNLVAYTTVQPTSHNYYHNFSPLNQLDSSVLILALYISYSLIFVIGRSEWNVKRLITEHSLPVSLGVPLWGRLSAVFVSLSAFDRLVLFLEQFPIIRNLATSCTFDLARNAVQCRTIQDLLIDLYEKYNFRFWPAILRWIRKRAQKLKKRWFLSKGM